MKNWTKVGIKSLKMVQFFSFLRHSFKESTPGVHTTELIVAISKHHESKVKISSI